MANQEINIVIDPDGTVHVDLINYKGTACALDANKLLSALGTLTASKRKQEYYKDNQVHIHQSE